MFLEKVHSERGGVTYLVVGRGKPYRGKWDMLAKNEELNSQFGR